VERCGQDPEGYSVLVLTDNELARRGLHDMLRSVELVTQVNTVVTSHPDQVPLPRHRPVDLLVIACDDLECEGVNLVADAARRDGTKILLLIDRKTDCLDTVTRFPGNGFLIKDDVTEDALASALNRIIAGEVPMPAMLANRLLARARGETPPEYTASRTLTPRERETLNLLTDGLSNKQIARRMLISQHSVKRLVANILSKLHCSNRTLAAAVAIKEGLLE
jgi:two-component system, NarL family, nitrate/nitrite response regulator NarL